ncbi:uncharacterized protein LOC144473567 [Augochlora pura]
MDCTREKLEKTNVFQANIIVPLIKMVDTYEQTKHEFSPDEFCIALFAAEEPTERCSMNFNLVRDCCSHPEQFKSLPVPIQDIIMELFMNIARYEHFLEGVSRHFLRKRRRHSDTLTETMVFLYILAYRVCNLFFEDSVECFEYFKFRKVFFMVSYLLRPETPSIFHKIGCSDFDEDFVEQKLILPLLEATPCLEKQELSEKLEKWKEQHNKEMAEIVERCRIIEQNSRDAFNAMMDEKRQKAAEVSEESRQLKAQLAKQREEEIQKKIRLIQEIKTIQSLRTLPYKDFDPTESSGLGLLCEMSLAELKERLFWMKMKLNEEIENRKCIVSRERERQKTMIKDTRKALEDYKVSNAMIGINHCLFFRRNNVASSKPVQQPAVVVTSPEVDALRKQLEERRAVRLRKASAREVNWK